MMQVTQITAILDIEKKAIAAAQADFPRKVGMTPNPYSEPIHHAHHKCWKNEYTKEINRLEREARMAAIEQGEAA
jgi:hypothetical protein